MTDRRSDIEPTTASAGSAVDDGGIARSGGEQTVAHPGQARHSSAGCHAGERAVGC